MKPLLDKLPLDDPPEEPAETILFPSKWYHYLLTIAIALLLMSALNTTVDALAHALGL